MRISRIENAGKLAWFYRQSKWVLMLTLFISALSMTVYANTSWAEDAAAPPATTAPATDTTATPQPAEAAPSQPTDPNPPQAEAACNVTTGCTSFACVGGKQYKYNASGQRQCCTC